MDYEKILIFGDSITWGADDSEGLGWANRFRKDYETKGGNAAVYNLGIRGDTTNGLLKRFEVEAEARKSDNACILFAIGINDSRFINSLETPETTLEKFKSNLEKLVSLSGKFSKSVILVGLTNVLPDTINLPRVGKSYIYTNENIKRYNQVIQEIADRYQYKFINLQNLLDEGDFYEDGLHPNAQGHSKICEVVKSGLKI